MNFHLHREDSQVGQETQEKEKRLHLKGGGL